MSDPYLANVTMLLHFDGNDGDTSTSDSSLNNLPISFTSLTGIATGEKISSNQAKFGTTSLYVAPSGTVSPGRGGVFCNSPFGPFPNLLTNDFTVECWVYQASASFVSTSYIWSFGYSQYLFVDGSVGVSGANTIITLTVTDTVSTTMIIGGTTLTGAALTYNTWHHVAGVRIGTAVSYYLDGVLQQAGTAAGNLGTQAYAYPTVVLGRDPTSRSTQYSFPGYIDEFRVTQGVGRYTANFTPPTAPFDSPVIPPGPRTVFLGHFDGVSGSTAFVDSSPYGPRTWAQSGCTLSNAQTMFGPTSLYSAPGNGYAGFTEGSEFGLGTVDHTYELFVYPINPFPGGSVFRQVSFGSIGGSMWLIYDWYSNASYTPGVQLLSQSGQILHLVSTVAATINAWNHIAIVRHNNVEYIYVNGVLGASAPLPTLDLGGIGSNDFLSIGGDALGIANFTGYIDEFMITIGLARYTAPFTPPAAPFNSLPLPTTTYNIQGDPNFSSDSLLLHMDGTNGSTTFVDSSPSPLTVTATGAAQNDTAPTYTSSFNGTQPINVFAGTGVGKFSTATQTIAAGLTVPVVAGGPLDISTGDFTIEGWFMQFGAPPNIDTVFFEYSNGLGYAGYSYGFQFEINTQNALISFKNGSSSLVTGGTPYATFYPYNCWHHIAVVRSGNTGMMFFNGFQQNSPPSVTWSGPIFDNTHVSLLTIGNSIDGPVTGLYFNGYLDEVRVTKGLARYTSNFTPLPGPFGGLVPVTIPSGGYAYGRFVSAPPVTKAIQLGNVGAIEPRIWAPISNRTVRSTS